MDDLISREAAIGRAVEIPLFGKLVKVVAVSELEALPSAQPEEDCDTCKHGYFGNTCCNNCKVRFPSHYERRTDD